MITHFPTELSQFFTHRRWYCSNRIRACILHENFSLWELAGPVNFRTCVAPSHSFGGRWEESTGVAQSQPALINLRGFPPLEIVCFLSHFELLSHSHRKHDHGMSRGGLLCRRLWHWKLHLFCGFCFVLDFLPCLEKEQDAVYLQIILIFLSEWFFFNVV